MEQKGEKSRLLRDKSDCGSLEISSLPLEFCHGGVGNSFLLDEKKIVNLTHLMSSITISMVIINVQ